MTNNIFKQKATDTKTTCEEMGEQLSQLLQRSRFHTAFLQLAALMVAVIRCQQVYSTLEPPAPALRVYRFRMAIRVSGGLSWFKITEKLKAPFLYFLNKK